MDPSLTPELALAYLRELSVDLTSAIVVDGDGRRLAGPSALTEPACALLAVPAATDGLAVRTTAGWAFAIRSHRFGVVVATGPLALVGLVLHDLSEVVALLGGRIEKRVGEATAVSSVGVEALGEAVQRAVGDVATL